MCSMAGWGWGSLDAVDRGQVRPGADAPSPPPSGKTPRKVACPPFPSYTEIHKSGDLVRVWNYRCTNIFLDPLTGRFVREQMSR